MDFRENPAIYIQIAEYVTEQILLKKWALTEKIPSIRELAVSMGVNPNTVQHAYDFLQQRSIITNKRGIGHMVEAGAMERIISFRREQFIEHELPVFFKTLFLLNMNIKDISRQYDHFVEENFKNSQL